MFVALALAFAAPPAPVAVIDLWPAAAPGETADRGPEVDNPTKPGQMEVRRLGNVSKPAMSLFLPPKDKATGQCVLVCPGGGYSILAIEHEGTEVAAWLNSLGVAAAVLKYRVPKRPGQSPDNLAQRQDVQRAMGLLRAQAADRGFDPKRVGVLGFSAGGHLAACACTDYAKRRYDRVDAADDEPCRPAFGVFVYPAYLVDKAGDLHPEFAATKETPPAFFAHAGDDPVTPESSVQFYRSLKKAGVPAELHVYASGGHGFGMRPGRGPVSEWPARCADWLRGK